MILAKSRQEDTWCFRNNLKQDGYPFEGLSDKPQTGITCDLGPDAFTRVILPYRPPPSTCSGPTGFGKIL